MVVNKVVYINNVVDLVNSSSGVNKVDSDSSKRCCQLESSFVSHEHSSDGLIGEMGFQLLVSFL